MTTLNQKVNRCVIHIDDVSVGSYSKISPTEAENLEKSASCAFSEKLEQAVSTDPNMHVEPSRIDKAIAACRAAYQQGGHLLSAWGTAAAPVLQLCLEILEAIDADGAAEECVLKAVKAEIKGKAPAKGKPELLAVFLCRQPQDAKARHECARFASLVKVAREDKVVPDGVVAYLQHMTLTQALERVRATSGHKPKVLKSPLSKKAHPHLCAALCNAGSRSHVLAARLLSDALIKIETELKEAR